MRCFGGQGYFSFFIIIILFHLFGSIVSFFFLKTNTHPYPPPNRKVEPRDMEEAIAQSITKENIFEKKLKEKDIEITRLQVLLAETEAKNQELEKKLEKK